MPDPSDDVCAAEGQRVGVVLTASPTVIRAARSGIGTKKTGPNSQGVTERPGEFSNWHFSSYQEKSEMRLYPTQTGKR